MQLSLQVKFDAVKTTLKKTSCSRGLASLTVLKLLCCISGQEDSKTLYKGQQNPPHHGRAQHGNRSTLETKVTFVNVVQLVCGHLQRQLRNHSFHCQIMTMRSWQFYRDCVSDTGSPSYCAPPEWHQSARHLRWSSTGLLSFAGALNHSRSWRRALPRPRSSLQMTKQQATIMGPAPERGAPITASPPICGALVLTVFALPLSLCANP